MQKVVGKLQKVVKELLDRWDLRQPRTKLQEATLTAFGQIHDSDDINSMIVLMNEVISNLPANQSVLFDESCFAGFLAWNNFWKESHARENVKGDLDPLTNVHMYYENWRKSSIEKNLPFQKLWENLMVRSKSEAICETTGSMMNQQSGKNQHLNPNNFNVEMFFTLVRIPFNNLL